MIDTDSPKCVLIGAVPHRCDMFWLARPCAPYHCWWTRAPQWTELEGSGKHCDRHGRSELGSPLLPAGFTVLE